MKKNRIQFPLHVFYDGSCIVCSREMAHYRQVASEDLLLFTDASAADFDPSIYGLTREDFMAQLHVRDAQGRFLTGVDAFLALWEALPGFPYRLLEHILSWPGMHFLAKAGYRVFARLRRYLPQNAACDDGQCGIGHRREKPGGP